MSLVLTSGPAAEPLSVEALREHCHIDGGEHDGYLEALGRAARERVEADTGRALITQTWTLHLDAFPKNSAEPILLYPSPVQAVNSVVYSDVNGTDTTLDATDYQVDLNGRRARVLPAYGMVWPTTRSEMNAVSVEFDCGYGASGDDVPANLLHAMKILVGSWFEHREEVLAGAGLQAIGLPAPMAYDWLIWHFRLMEF